MRTTLLSMVSIVAIGCGNGSPGPTDAFYAYDITTDLGPPTEAEAPYDASYPGSAQDPPTTNRSDLEAWLATGMYRSWHCETSPHPARPPSPHSDNRICNNDAIWSFTGTGEYPVDSASVKEIYDSTETTIIGYAVNRHVRAGTDGADWWWYERLPLDSAAPHDDAGVVASGPGTDGPARAICTACHSEAGSDAQHSGHDFVYTQVSP